jgi:hypothetical protein
MTIILNGTTGVTFPNGVTMSDGTSAPVTAAQGGTGLSSVGTAGNVLTSNGTTWTSAAAAGFPTGTVLIFAQTAAPTGWTKNTSTGDNSALRVVTGTASTGGSVAFTTAFASGLSAGATTLSTAQIPSHTHTVGGNDSNTGTSLGRLSTRNPDNLFNTATGAEGGGGSHTHTIPSLAVQYIDVIRATKD